MGPPDRMPLLPKFEVMEDLGPDERYYVLDNSFSSHADLKRSGNYTSLMAKHQ